MRYALVVCWLVDLSWGFTCVVFWFSIGVIFAVGVCCFVCLFVLVCCLSLKFVVW